MSREQGPDASCPRSETLYNLWLFSESGTRPLPCYLMYRH